jgi:hypothetical protein
MIVLGTSVSTGGLDPNATNYTHAKVMQYGHTAHYDDAGALEYTVRFSWVYGYLASGVFRPGVKPASAPITLSGDDLAPLLAVEGRVGEGWHDHSARVIYEYLISNVAELAGSTVEEA